MAEQGTVKWFNDAKGLWLYQPPKWRRRLRAFLRDSGWRLPQPARRPNRAVRRDQSPKGWQAENVQAV